MYQPNREELIELEKVIYSYEDERMYVSPYPYVDNFHNKVKILYHNSMDEFVSRFKYKNSHHFNNFHNFIVPYIVLLAKTSNIIVITNRDTVPYGYKLYHTSTLGFENPSCIDNLLIKNDMHISEFRRKILIEKNNKPEPEKILFVHSLLMTETIGYSENSYYYGIRYAKNF